MKKTLATGSPFITYHKTSVLLLLTHPSLSPTIISMCFVVQWQLHVSRAFLRQDGRCVNMPPLASESDAQLLRSIILGPTPTAVESRSDPASKFGKPTIQCFKHCEADQWLVADADNSKAIKVCKMGGYYGFDHFSCCMSWHYRCNFVTFTCVCDCSLALNATARMSIL
jgi:hypothetical protein